MGKDTLIQWCDSSLNLMMGCDGCELWNDRKRSCYAGRQTENRAGWPGWPVNFATPKLFVDRLEAALKWKDLTGTKREQKPWLDGLPRLVFLNDMGDTFTESLPLGWMKPLIPRLADSPHHWLILTKRPRRFLQFSEECPLPPNVWPGTTVTNAKTAKRVEYLTQIRTGGPKWVSAEPLWEQLPSQAFEGVQWVIFGGESGPEAQHCKTDWIYTGMAAAARSARFVKQLGLIPIHGEIGGTLLLEDKHGGDWSEWPEDLKVREMPECNYQGALL